MKSHLLSLSAAAILAPSCLAGFPNLVVETIVEKQIQSPTAITHAGDGSGRLFVCDQRGRIHVIRNGMLLPTPFLDIAGKLVPERTSFDERGLLGIAFHPQYGQSGQPGQGRFYLFYSAVSPNAPGTATNPVDCRSVIAEYRISPTNPETADPASERILLSFDKPQFNHNGGQLAFGPDGFLYIGSGDGGSGNDNAAGHTGGSAARPTNALGNAQDLASWMGKIHRIDPLGTNGPGGQYGIPADNPFAGAAGVREEVWSYGLRNPWRFTFDRLNGRLFCADVGQGSVEEVDIITKGANYGWRNREGTFVPSFSIDAPALVGTVVDPIAQYAHPNVVIGNPVLPQHGVSITGGVLYRGNAIPGLQGKYVFGDYSEDGINPKGVLLGLEESGPVWTMAKLPVASGNPIGYFLQTFGEDESGEIYIGAKLNRPPSAQVGGFPAGAILKLSAAPVVTREFLAQKDNTIYSEANNSNALGQHLFIGKTGNGAIRRALVRFDVSSIPAGSPVSEASLELKVTKTTSGAISATAHRLSRDWGATTSMAAGEEGSGAPAGAGDATWTAPMNGQLPNWTLAGGDFLAPTAPAVSVASSPAVFTGLAADVQVFVDQPAANFGWLVRGDELSNTSTKRFGSSDHSQSAPKLTVRYEASSLPLSHRQSWERQYFLIGEFIDENGDLDADGVVNLIEYAWNRSPLAGTTTAGTFSAERSGDSLVIRFLRDPRATDLTYTLEAGDNLGAWSPIITSNAGAVASGSAFQSEADVVGNPPLKQVTGSLAIGPGRKFVRLRITRP
jgi:glucose/arabinose dehydrogenase